MIKLIASDLDGTLLQDGAQELNHQKTARRNLLRARSN